MTTFEAINKHWEEEKHLITYSWISDYRPNRLRWVVRKGKKILQQALYVKVQFSKVVWKHGDFTKEDSGYVWFDVPVEEEE